MWGLLKQNDPWGNGPSQCKVSASNQGVALIAALVLVGMVTLIAATILQTTSTEIATSGHFKSAVQSLYSAEAGIEEARARLRERGPGKSIDIADPNGFPNPNWVAYISTSQNWEPTLDPRYSNQETNFFPTSLLTNTQVVANSLQGENPYWVRIQHKREYEAEQLGHRPDHAHYQDRDGAVSLHKKTNPGKILYFGYPDSNASRPTQFTSHQRVPYQTVKFLQAHGGFQTNHLQVEVDVVHPPGPKQLAPMYAQQSITLHGNASVISGRDRCQAVTGLPPIYSNLPVNVTTGSPTFSGNPSTPQVGKIVVDIQQEIQTVKAEIIPLREHQRNARLGSPTDYAIFLDHIPTTQATEALRIQNSIGYGILMSLGDIQLQGRISWNGIILAGGKLTLDGQGSTIQINGGIWAQEIMDISGNLEIQYDSCVIQKALASQPLRVVRWKEDF
jgi:type II secretory pathway pseudopilin PulG